MGFWNKLLGRAEAPKQEEKELVTQESPEQVHDRLNKNTEITINAISETIMSSDRVSREKGLEGKMAEESRKEQADELAREAVHLLTPEQMENMQTMDTAELRESVGYLAGAAVEAYDKRQVEIATSVQESADAEKEDAADADAAKEDAQKEAA